MTNSDQEADKPYVLPFIRRRMPNATEEEILEANENMRQYLLLLWRIHLREEEERESSKQQSDHEPIGLG